MKANQRCVQIRACLLPTDQDIEHQTSIAETPPKRPRLELEPPNLIKFKRGPGPAALGPSQGPEH